MTAPPERSAERDSAIAAVLPRVPDEGWTVQALRNGLAQAGADARDAELLFPSGPLDMVEVFCDLADRRMTEAAAAEGVGSLRLSQRVRAIVALRLAQNQSAREAIRRALALLATPRGTAAAVRCTARTVDAIWHAAGDRSADFSWYTKRGILAAIYGATLLFWLRDDSEGAVDTLDFLDRRLAGAARIGKLRARLAPSRPSA